MKVLFLFTLPLILFLISGCTDFRQATGREKITFDEFAVLEQKLLEIPQTFELNLTDKSTNIQTHSIKTFNNLLNIKIRSKMDGDDKFFATLFKLDEIQLGIREIVFNETLQLKNSKRAGIDILTNKEPDPLMDEILDVSQELERLKNNGIIPVN